MSTVSSYRDTMLTPVIVYGKKVDSLKTRSVTRRSGTSCKPADFVASLKNKKRKTFPCLVVYGTQKVDKSLFN